MNFSSNSLNVIVKETAKPGEEIQALEKAIQRAEVNAHNMATSLGVRIRERLSLVHEIQSDPTGNVR